MAKNREKALIRTLMLNLYAQDTQSLMRDLAKLAVMGTAQVQPSQRAAMLHAFISVLSLYVADFKEILSMYDQVEGDYKDGRPDLG